MKKEVESREKIFERELGLRIITQLSMSEKHADHSSHDLHAFVSATLFTIFR